jgi:hypothetical protein
MRWLIPEEVHSFNHELPDGRRMVFDGFWRNFRPAEDYAFWIDLLPRHDDSAVIRVLGPFWRKNNRFRLEALYEAHGPWDYYITGESRDNPTDLAKKCIGFRVPQSDAEIRFPYWQWYLTWPGYEVAPPYRRFGERLSIDKLMQPISAFSETPSREAYQATATKAVLLTSHFKRHRRRLRRWTDKAMGCDAFGRKIRPTDLPKKELCSQYPFNLCPENNAAEGYITEKVPEGFLCGCIPITYSRPEDLEKDFNPRAVINLFGRGRKEIIELLREIATDYSMFEELRAEPLLLERPSLEPLIDFIER